MKGSTLCTVALLLSAVSTSLAAVGMGFAVVHDNHPNQCYEAKSGSYFSPGESWPMEETCGKWTCEKWSSRFMVSFTTCGTAGTRSPCYLVQDMTKPYPGCCHTVVCRETKEDMFASSEENLVSPSSTLPSYSQSEGNDIAGTAKHFILGRTDNFGGERNDLNSLEDGEANMSDYEYYEYY